MNYKDACMMSPSCIYIIYTKLQICVQQNPLNVVSFNIRVNLIIIKFKCKKIS